METKTKAKGYKGHRAGSARERAHKLVDENPKAERKDLTTKIVKFGVAPGTATNWVSVFRKKGSVRAAVVAKKPETKKVVVAAKKTPAAKPTASPSKKPVVKSKAPVIKTPAQAVGGATEVAPT